MSLTATETSFAVSVSQSVTEVCPGLGTGSAELQAGRCLLSASVDIVVVRMRLAGSVVGILQRIKGLSSGECVLVGAVAAVNGLN